MRRKTAPPVFTDKVCPVCHITHRRLGSLCSKHESNMRRIGSATGKFIKNHDLDIYRPLVQMMLNRYTNDPAIMGGLALMEELLRNYGKNCDHATVGRKARPYIDKLMSMGATVRSSFIECASVAFLYEITEYRPPSDEMNMAYATRLLLHKRVWCTGQGRSNWARSTIGGLGYRINSDLGALFLQMARVCVKQDLAHREQLRAASQFTG